LAPQFRNYFELEGQTATVGKQKQQKNEVIFMYVENIQSFATH